MERLTIRNSDGTYSQPTHTTFEKIFYKLAEIEDFMEETGIKDFAELKRILTTNAVWQDNQKHKYRWKMLKDWAERLEPYTMITSQAVLIAVHEIEKVDQ